MFATIFSGSTSKMSGQIKIFFNALILILATLPQMSAAQEFALVAMPPNLTGAMALARAEAKPEAGLSLLERLETLEELSESNAPAEIKALFADGLPCQLHARTEDGAEITEVHPLFPAHVEATEAAPTSVASPAPLPKMTPTPKPVVQPLMSATAADAPYVNEKISSLQKMVDLVQAKEKLMQSRAYYEKKLGEFDSKVGKE